MLVAMVATLLAVPFIVLLTLQLKSHDSRLAPLAYIQLICGTILLLEVLLPVILIGVGAFRPERAPELTQLINDTSFTILLWPFSPATLESAAVGLAILMDRGAQPLFSRWIGYFDLGVAAIFAAGAPTLFVKHGAFGWDGALAFWAVLIGFALWVMVTFTSMLRAIGRQPQ